MRLFYLINGWAGHSEWLDTSLRLFYVGAVPLLATALAALLVLVPRREHGFPRRRVWAATLLSLLLCTLVMYIVPLFQQQFLNGVSISPRPFMTNWVNALVVEPNDNSFPCYEVMFAAALASLLWAAAPLAGALGWTAVLVLGFARTFCGMNYIADSVAGAVIGGALATLSLAALHVPLQLPALKRSAPLLTWRLRHQTAIATLTLLGFASFSYYSLANSPTHGARFKTFWGASTAQAAPSAEQEKIAATPLPSDIHEGEGGVLAAEAGKMSVPGQMLLESEATRLDGHKPAAEEYLTDALSSLDIPHRIIGVNVAEVTAGTTPYRCAAIRFEVKWHGPIERRRVAETAALVAKRAFHADAQLQHLDVLGMKLNGDDAASHSPTRPVFTASIDRRDLIVRDKPAWVNWSGLDGGSWLRARSALYIDPRVLPATAPDAAQKKTEAQPTKQSASASGATKAIAHAGKPTAAKPAVKRQTVTKTTRRKAPSKRRYRTRRSRNSR